MVDLQGVERQGVFTLTDPAIHRFKKTTRILQMLMSILVTMEPLEKPTKKPGDSINTSRLTSVTNTARVSAWTNINDYI